MSDRTEEQILADYLKAETEDNLKSAKYGTIMFAILVVVVFGYFQWLKSALNDVMQPEALAISLVHEIDNKIPTMTESLETNIKDVLPRVAKYTMDTVVDKSIPAMRMQAEDYLGKHSDSLVEFTSQMGDEVFVAVLRQKRDEIKAKNPAEGLEPDKAKLVTDLKAAIKLEMTSGLNQKLTEGSEEDADQESAAAKLQKSQVALRNINARLNALAENNDPNRTQALNKRIIGAWWNWLQKSQTANASEPENPEQEETNAQNDAEKSDPGSRPGGADKVRVQ